MTHARRFTLERISDPEIEAVTLAAQLGEVAEVGRWLDNYRKLKQAIEAICELNHELLRPEPRRRRSGGRHD